MAPTKASQSGKAAVSAAVFTVAARTVTVRHRDSMLQDRVGLDHVSSWIAERLEH